MADTPHALGRIPSPPDDRDFTVRELRRLSTGPDLSMTLGEFMETQWSLSWTGILAFWRWIKSQRKPQPMYAGWTMKIDALDQGDFGTCVGNGFAHWAALTPTEDPGVDEKLARTIYYEATVEDGSPDDPDVAGGGQQGATVRSGAKAMQKRGRLAAYAFARNIEEMDDWLDHHGPVVVGTEWTNSMFYPDRDGLVKVEGPSAGGHCWVVVDRLDNGTYKSLTSWGTSFGKDGYFYVRRDDLRRLLADGGEACLTLELPL